jgi:hypothetical protein
MNKNKKKFAYGRVLDKIYLPEEYDKRRKLTKAQHEEIKKKYKTGKYSRYDLASQYGVAYGTIQRLTSEKARIQLLEAHKRYYKKVGRKPYDSMELRRRKKYLAEKGILIIKE